MSWSQEWVAVGLFFLTPLSTSFGAAIGLFALLTPRGHAKKVTIAGTFGYLAGFALGTVVVDGQLDGGPLLAHLLLTAISTAVGITFAILLAEGVLTGPNDAGA